MNKTITEQRDLSPQWLGKGKNLGDYTVNAVRFTGAGLIAFMQEKPIHADMVAHMLGGQMHIAYGSRIGQRMASEGAEEKQEGETLEEWKERVYPAVLAKAKAVLPGATLDYTKELRDSVEAFSKRGQGGDKRLVLPDYHKIVGNIEKGWEGGAMEKRTSILAKLALAPELAAGDVADVLKAIETKYKADTVKVSESDLF